MNWQKQVKFRGLVKTIDESNRKVGYTRDDICYQPRINEREIQICLNCTREDCNGYCEDIKGVNNDEN